MVAAHGVSMCMPHAPQLKHTRKEWDINRPDRSMIDDPARVGDDDPRLGASSMQKFDGEDLSAADRKREQMAQAKGWWEEQAAHKAALRAAQKEAELAYGELMRYQVRAPFPEGGAGGGGRGTAHTAELCGSRLCTACVRALPVGPCRTCFSSRTSRWRRRSGASWPAPPAR